MVDERRAKRYCKDDISKIENYKNAVNDNTQSYDIHHRNELTLDGKFAHTKEDLIRMNMYYDRPCNELIFLTKGEHTALHRKVSHHSEETKQNMSESRKGEKNPFYGKTHSDEFRKNHSKLLKGKTWKVIDGKRVWLSKEGK